MLNFLIFISLDHNDVGSVSSSHSYPQIHFGFLFSYEKRNEIEQLLSWSSSCAQTHVMLLHSFLGHMARFSSRFTKHCLMIINLKRRVEHETTSRTRRNINLCSDTMLSACQLRQFPSYSHNDAWIIGKSVSQTEHGNLRSFKLIFLRNRSARWTIRQEELNNCN